MAYMVDMPFQFNALNQSFSYMEVNDNLSTLLLHGVSR